jgi:hypothetical protein
MNAVQIFHLCVTWPYSTWISWEGRVYPLRFMVAQYLLLFAIFAPGFPSLGLLLFRFRKRFLDLSSWRLLGGPEGTRTSQNRSFSPIDLGRFNSWEWKLILSSIYLENLNPIECILIPKSLLDYFGAQILWITWKVNWEGMCKSLAQLEYIWSVLKLLFFYGSGR